MRCSVLPIVYVVSLALLLTSSFLATLFPIETSATESEWKVFHTQYYGIDFEIPYSIQNGTLDNISLDIKNEKVSAMVKGQMGTPGGELFIQISKNLIWSDFLNAVSYNITIDGKEKSGSFKVIKTATCYDQLAISIPEGSHRIEITSPYANQSPRLLNSDGFIATDKAC